ncbi:MAG: 23S rRNA (guanosine(2251)-2'-O)-methyltransferase RlmB [Deltaproteobacteria bacterium]|nr:23S rRNA (guanosine(2251)-2'-O)-methyltransferase RlmB [Deltaproteobacteria bacterium]
MPYLFDKDEIIEALEKKPSSVRRLYIERERAHIAHKLIELAKTKGIQFKVLPEVAFRNKVNKKGVHFFLEIEPKTYLEPEVFLDQIKRKKSPLIFAFDGIYDPQNFGNILRSAGCFALDGVVLPRDRCCAITDKVMEISKGGYERVNLVRVVNLPRYLDNLKSLGLQIFALHEKGEKSIYEVDLKGPVCLVLGREDGLRNLTQKKCDLLIRIPTSEKFPSLNLATCFAISLYEASRQRRSCSV